jgi:hypothetical protein
LFRVRVLAIIVAAAAAVGAPIVTTGPAVDVSTSSATVTGTVDPNGLATTYQVEYGTTTAYGFATGTRAIGADSGPVRVREPLTGLQPNTAYHYRVVASNASGVVKGADATLHTAVPVAPPKAVTQVPRDVGATGTVLRGKVVPNGAQTKYHFQYGPTVEYGRTTPGGTIAADAGPTRLAEPLTGLMPYTRYHMRLVATNAAGRTVGLDKTFYTLRAPTGVTITADPARPVWGAPVAVMGAVSGEGIRNIEVMLEQATFPFTAGMQRVGGEMSTDAAGYYVITLPAVYSATQVRVVTNTKLVAESPVITLPVAVKVGLVTKRLAGRRASVSGTVWPAAPRGRATLQRHGRKRRWIKVARTKLRVPSPHRSRYRFRLRSPRPGRYRVVVAPRDDGAHVTGVSRRFRLPVPRYGPRY